MNSSPHGVAGKGLLILSVLLVGCTGSPGSPQTSTNSVSQQLVDEPQKGTFAEVHGWIVYRSGSQIMAVDPANPQDTLSLGPAHGADPIGWSPDGTRLLLQTTDANGIRTDLYVLNADGSKTRLTHGVVSECCGGGHSPAGGSFSPDGTMVVYGDGGELYVVDANGGRPRLLAGNGPGGAALFSPAWSPDGSLVAFPSILGEGDSIKAAISVMKADGTGRRVIVGPGAGGTYARTIASGLAWSPDGSHLAFSSVFGHIYFVGADGSGLRQITDGGLNFWPSWSPDGSRIAFMNGPFLNTMAIDGSDLQQVFLGEDYSSIAWNPIG